MMMIIIIMMIVWRFPAHDELGTCSSIVSVSPKVLKSPASL